MSQKIVINTLRWAEFSLSDAAFQWLREHGCEAAIYSPHTIHNLFVNHRDHPLLVACVEALGDEASNRGASLKVVEIPDDVEWYIDECEGAEVVNENHRWWS